MNDFEELAGLLKKSKEHLRNGENDKAWKILNIDPRLAQTFNSDSAILTQINFCKQRAKILKKEKNFEGLLFQELKTYLLSVLNEISKFPFGSEYVWFENNCSSEESILLENKNITTALKELSIAEHRDNIFKSISDFAFSELPKIYGIENEILHINISDLEPMKFVALNREIEKLNGKSIDIEIYKMSELIKSSLSDRLNNVI